MLYSYQNQYPTELPERIRLSDGRTRTDSSTFTEEELADAGFIPVKDLPSCEGSTHKVIWNNNTISWEVVPKTDEELAEEQEYIWKELRETRDMKIKEVEWRVFRYQSQIRLGLDPVDNIEKLDFYIQSLRDITSTVSNPLEVVWPTLE